MSRLKKNSVRGMLAIWGKGWDFQELGHCPLVELKWSDGEGGKIEHMQSGVLKTKVFTKKQPSLFDLGSIP